MDPDMAKRILRRRSEARVCELAGILRSCTWAPASTFPVDAAGFRAVQRIPAPISLPVVGCAPEWMSEKAVSITTWWPPVRHLPGR